MSNVIQIELKRNRMDGQKRAVNAGVALSVPAKTALLRSNARDTLSHLADQLEIAMQHARAIEPKMRDSGARQAFGDRIEIVQRMLDIARVKILQL